MDLPEITKIEVINVQDGDVLAIFVKGHHMKETLERLKIELAEKFLPKKIEVAIVNADLIDLKVLQAE